MNRTDIRALRTWRHMRGRTANLWLFLAGKAFVLVRFATERSDVNRVSAHPNAGEGSYNLARHPCRPNAEPKSRTR